MYYLMIIDCDKYLNYTNILTIIPHTNNAAQEGLKYVWLRRGSSTVVVVWVWLVGGVGVLLGNLTRPRLLRILCDSGLKPRPFLRVGTLPSPFKNSLLLDIL